MPMVFDPPPPPFPFVSFMSSVCSSAIFLLFFYLTLEYYEEVGIMYCVLHEIGTC